MTLHNRSHAVFGLRKVETSRATLETSFKISDSSWGSDVISVDVAQNIFDGVEVKDAVVANDGDNDGISINVTGIKSSMYMLIVEDRFLLENVRPVMKGWRFPMTRLCPIEAIAGTIAAASIMFEFRLIIVPL
mmetsp:Transcript_1824/g.3465  ORF Transcript_1824/g.3465 Transcript_1824/m.3465 type:complete len:133 (-) Transcript_1824:115-513(-)